MSVLLDLPPFAARDDVLLLQEMNAITRWHCDGCEPYRRVWPHFREARAFADLPFLHAGAFKQREWLTVSRDLKHQRQLMSSSTSGQSSRIALDAHSSSLQSRSSTAILKAFVGDSIRPLIVLDSARALQQRGEISARITAAMSLRPLASEIHFIVKEQGSDARVDWATVESLCRTHAHLLVYGFTWMLWTSWAAASIPSSVMDALNRTQIHFVHSGGWKRLESLGVDREAFDSRLLARAGPGSSVLDFYGLVEQVGIIYPLCESGFRHAPRWATVLVRDPWTLDSLDDRAGMLQLMNPLAFGAPYHNVLTEDIGRVIPGPCPCGADGVRFEFHGRVPRAEARGCANV
jgi:hypothetical protein